MAATRSKDDPGIQYHEIPPTDRKRCGTCAMFYRPSSISGPAKNGRCQLVVGVIDATRHVCLKWIRKEQQ